MVKKTQEIKTWITDKAKTQCLIYFNLNSFIGFIVIS